MDVILGRNLCCRVQTNLLSFSISNTYAHSIFNSEVMANREPNFMKSGKIVIDRMHVKNHVNCSRSYNSNLYPELKGINTQKAEQLNSELSKIGAMVAYSKPKSAWQVLNTYMCTKNYIRKCNK